MSIDKVLGLQQLPVNGHPPGLVALGLDPRGPRRVRILENGLRAKRGALRMHHGNLLCKLRAYNCLTDHRVLCMHIKIPSMLTLRSSTAHASMFIKIFQLPLAKGHRIIILHRFDPLAEVDGAGQSRLLGWSVVWGKVCLLVQLRRVAAVHL